MRRIWSNIIACGLCITMLGGCNGGNTQKEAEEKQDSQKTAVEMVKKVKEKYVENETADYAEPMYNLEKNHVFTFENLPEKFFQQEEFDCFSVYYDSGLKNSVDITIEKDYENKSVTIKPRFTFSIDDEEGNIEEGTWGSRSKFWFVRNVDVTTGEMLEKPVVTVFSTKEELDTPTLQQSVGEDGWYRLSWSKVEGADYYEVYEFADIGGGSAFSEITTEGTTVSYKDFKTETEHEQRFEERYKDTEIDVTEKVSMNCMLQKDGIFFVVAKTRDGKQSGLSNFCEVKDIASQVPYMIEWDFQTEYEGEQATVLPAYVDMEMKDGSVGKFLIEYHGGIATSLTDGRIMLECKIKNLPIEMRTMFFKGMEFEAFLEDMENVTKREDQLATKSITAKKNINVPYVPDQDYQSSASEETEEESEVQENNYGKFDLSEEIEKSVYATSAMSEWIAINMLNHQEQIYLGDFPESSDSEKVFDAIWEAYTQNPLIGVMDEVSYDYKTDGLKVTYQLSKEDTAKMQEASLSKAKEIVWEIIRDDMSDYEKEEAINEYLCSNGSYNDDIKKYIKDDGTVDNKAIKKFVQSFTPYGILVENEGVCEAYAEAFLLLAKEAGMEVVIVTGTLDGVSHEWNRVKLDGQWYSMDVTNNDSDILPNCYFNLPDKLAGTMLKQDKKAFIDETTSDYVSDNMNNEYYTKHESATGDSSKAVKLLVNKLSSEKSAQIRLTGDLGEGAVEKIAQEVCNTARIGSADYYYRAGVLSIIKE